MAGVTKKQLPLANITMVSIGEQVMQKPVDE
jgi:hypothetical protein